MSSSKSSKDPDYNNIVKAVKSVEQYLDTSDISKFYDTVVQTHLNTPSVGVVGTAVPEEPEIRSRCVVCAKHLVRYRNPWQATDTLGGSHFRCNECGLVYFKEPPMKDEEYD